MEESGRAAIVCAQGQERGFNRANVLECVAAIYWINPQRSQVLARSRNRRDAFGDFSDERDCFAGACRRDVLARRK